MRRFLFAVLLACSALAHAGLFSSESPATTRSHLRSMSAQTLTQLYHTHPGAKHLITKSAGYAVFDAFSAKLLVAGGASGHGMAVDRSNSHTTYMSMVGAQAGFGLGAKSYRQVFVFESHGALNDFIHSGWEFGAQANASAKHGAEGGDYAGAISVAPGVWLYQLTETGLSVEATVTGSKYWVDSDLNP